jgi:phospholipid/cholesterol/gamma-HCH transport system substrate-binding protein
MTYNKMKLGVGIFILLFFLNIVIIISYILVQKGTFDTKYHYYFKAYSADSLSIGMPVKVSGFTVGYVNSIELQDDGSVVISFEVNSKNRKWVCDESVLMIRKPLLGSPTVILYSAIGNPVLKDGSTLKAIMSNDINDLVLKLEPIVNKMENIVTSVEKITTYLARDDSDVIKTIRNIQQFSANLVKHKSLLTSITGDQNATDSLIQTVNKLPKIVDNVNSLSVDVRKQIIPPLSEFIKQLQNITKDIQQKLKKLDKVVDSVSSSDKDIINIKQQVNTAITKSNELIEKVDAIFQDKNKNKVNLP